MLAITYWRVSVRRVSISSHVVADERVAQPALNARLPALRALRQCVRGIVVGYDYEFREWCI